MYFHITFLICFLIYQFNFIVKSQKNTNHYTTNLQKPHSSMDVIKVFVDNNNIINQNLLKKKVIKRKYSEEEFKKMNNQYALEQNNVQLMKDLAEDVIEVSSHPVYGGDRPSDCEQKDSYFCPSRKNSYDDWKCIKLEDLCDSYPDCPNYEDENPTICMFHILLKNHFQKFASVIKRTLESIREKK